MKRSTLKVVAAERPEPLTWNQLDTLARRLAVELMLEDVDRSSTDLLSTLMLEIGTHAVSDCSYAETIANLIRTHLYSITAECDRAETQHTQQARARVLSSLEAEGREAG